VLFETGNRRIRNKKSRPEVPNGFSENSADQAAVFFFVFTLALTAVFLRLIQALRRLRFCTLLDWLPISVFTFVNSSVVYRGEI
jgi:hypothetical protein